MNKFSEWYKRNLFLNQLIVAILFGWQILHLYWLATHVISEKILGYALYNPSELFTSLLVIADYFEIPALISGTILYFYSLKEGSIKKNFTYILLINSQWLHLFWITDEFIVETFTENYRSIIPAWLAWVAIFIDYLELPVIYDTIKKVIQDYLKRKPSPIEDTSRI